MNKLKAIFPEGKPVLQLPRPMGITVYLQMFNDLVYESLKRINVNPENIQFLQLTIIIIHDSEGRANVYYCGKFLCCFMSFKEFMKDYFLAEYGMNVKIDAGL